MDIFNDESFPTTLAVIGLQQLYVSLTNLMRDASSVAEVVRHAGDDDAPFE